jgi:protein-disulfide isomerase
VWPRRECHVHSRRLVGGRYDLRIARDVESGIASGVRGTPTLFLQERCYGGRRDAHALRAAIR